MAARAAITSLAVRSKSDQSFSSGVSVRFPIAIPLHVPLKTLPKGSMWTPFAERKVFLQFSFFMASIGVFCIEFASAFAARPVSRQG